MNWTTIFFAGWPSVLRAVISGALAYFALVVLLRVSGKRTLAKMNAFDLVVTVALGSVLATITLSKDVALAEGVAAIAVLVGLQFVVAWLSARFKAVGQSVKAEATLLFHRGDEARGDEARARCQRVASALPKTKCAPRFAGVEKRARKRRGRDFGNRRQFQRGFAKRATRFGAGECARVFGSLKATGPTPSSNRQSLLKHGTFH